MMANEQERRIYDRCLTRVGELEAENARLRELVQRMLRNMHGCNYYHNCGSCDFDECVYEANLRELGIEVDG